MITNAFSRFSRLTAALAVVSVSSSAPASAQERFDIGLLLGSTHATDERPVLDFDHGTTYQATFAWRAWQTRSTRVSIEIPFIATPAFTVLTPGPSLPLEYASLSLTPGIRVTVAPRGAGYARYSESKLKADRTPNPEQRDTNTGAIGFGGGVDVCGFGWLGFRGEVRDIYTGVRAFSLTTPGARVHNVVASGGLVVRIR